MNTILLQQLSKAELELHLMNETKKFTSAIHDGTPQDQKDIMRKRIEDIQLLLLEKRKQKNVDGSTAPESN